MKKMLAALALTACLTAAPLARAEAQTPKPVKIKLIRIEQSIEHNNWQKAWRQTADFQRYYRKNEWKYQLMGDEQEYEQLAVDIEQLKAAIKAKDRAGVLKLTANIKATLDQIFQL
ncbi:DUF4363 family protein [Caenibacillus caldisaponilyticus]|uniref:DUF4363 family protein n=1 Tax=Caenibacillus caldisaponilyticus TaxID=1674942 RepID=UPI0013010E54|nr:DUF4363 family protein [Caenibacillus caldisaponilyticus]